jgi:hypothetical protein
VIKPIGSHTTLATPGLWQYFAKTHKMGHMMILARRTLLLVGPAILAMSTVPLLAEGDERIHVVKDLGCPCCNAWIGHLRENGFNVSFEERSVEDLAAYKRERGIPENLSSCHTATIGDYTIEGHVPAADIRRLMAERPLAVGLSVPGMPFGSPGMGPETERQAYDVVLVGQDGSSTVFTSYPAA